MPPPLDSPVRHRGFVRVARKRQIRRLLPPSIQCSEMVSRTSSRVRAVCDPHSRKRIFCFGLTQPHRFSFLYFFFRNWRDIPRSRRSWRIPLVCCLATPHGHQEHDIRSDPNPARCAIFSFFFLLSSSFVSLGLNCDSTSRPHTPTLFRERGGGAARDCPCNGLCCLFLCCCGPWLPSLLPSPDLGERTATAGHQAQGPV